MSCLLVECKLHSIVQNVGDERIARGNQPLEVLSGDDLQ